MRMLRWAERRGFVEVQGVQPGERGSVVVPYESKVSMHTATPRLAGVHRLCASVLLIPTKTHLLLLDRSDCRMEDDGVDIDIPDDDFTSILTVRAVRGGRVNRLILPCASLTAASSSFSVKTAFSAQEQADRNASSQSVFIEAAGREASRDGKVLWRKG